MNVTGMFGRNGKISLWVDHGGVVNGNWEVYYHADTDEVSCGKDGERAQRLCGVYPICKDTDYNSMIDAHQKMLDEGRLEVIDKLFQMRIYSRSIWDHYKGCDLCKTCPSWPSTVCSEMARLRDLEWDLMRSTANEL
jgi:hypothetical protein